MQIMAATTRTLSLQGRVVIVTGASRGIGRAIASHLASLGARLVIGYVTNSSLAEALATEINSSSTPTTLPHAITARVDVSCPENVKSLFDLAEETFLTKPHIFVNSAGILVTKCPALADTSLEDFDSVFAVNARGAFLCLREAVNRITRGGGGRIIMITSSAVAGPMPRGGAYTASKAAVEAMVRVASKELHGSGITVNCVAPGPVVTDMLNSINDEEVVAKISEMYSAGRIGEVGDIAPVVGFLATDAAGMINGQVIRVDGGSI